MKTLYSLSGISKQGHMDALKREREQLLKAPLYIGFIEEIREMHPGMGLRKIYEQFEPEGIGRDAFIILGLREGYRLRALESPYKTTYSDKGSQYGNVLIGKRFTNVNQLWVSDLFYFPLGGQHYYVVLIMDVYSRRIIGYSVSDNMRSENNIAALTMALNLRGIDDYNNELIHHSDRGSQYTSTDYTNLLKSYGIRISMCTNVLENAHCERANGTIKNEYLKRWSIQNFGQLKKRVAMAVENYNNRLHNSLKMTPMVYETYIKDLKEKERPEMEVFTINKMLDNPMQLELQFDL
ncbi:MAG: DDE-type integrase/transposase/recombinase [Lewinellaceae bacterium]|nr:DDE-type integrase/transposase/recombinase [Bacteroidota bacterium]MCB9322819.1 DDE-type integrase/transposase/recombinase [Lewinellaceae bacterium]MCB9322827.1 DDE-type integrase/transposase/recombinase [Lewinellaceae bacterium]MCB9323066.1 DDE-type integrase/transposase/recombinase [Lewinellaceae bacterium]MCB9323706.1 DDE-type integrase/transposase/recombinase [Lewinellaceae bacterium]